MANLANHSFKIEEVLQGKTFRSIQIPKLLCEDSVGFFGGADSSKDSTARAIRAIPRPAFSTESK